MCISPSRVKYLTPNIVIRNPFESSALGRSFGTHCYKPRLLGGMLVAVGGRAKGLSFGAKPSRSKLKQAEFASMFQSIDGQKQ